MTFLITLLLVLPLMLLVGLLLRFGQNSLRQPLEKLLELTRLARSGQLDEAAWDFGLARPLFHDPEAETLRQALLQVEEQHRIGHTRIHHHKRDFLFTDDGLLALSRIEHQLERLVNKRNAAKHCP